MMSSLTGRCLCGAIHYRVSGQPLAVDHCHCESCRKASGAAFVTWFTVRAFDVVWHGDKLRWFAAAVGVERGFCGHCGSTMAYRHDAEPEEMDITAASLDHPESITPEHHVCFAERLPWVEPAMLAGLPVFERARMAGQGRRHGKERVTEPWPSTPV